MTTNKESNHELYIFFRHPLWRIFQHAETVNLLYKKGHGVVMGFLVRFDLEVKVKSKWTKNPINTKKD